MGLAETGSRPIRTLRTPVHDTDLDRFGVVVLLRPRGRQAEITATPFLMNIPTGLFVSISRRKEDQSDPERYWAQKTTWVEE